MEEGGHVNPDYFGGGLGLVPDITVSRTMHGVLARDDAMQDIRDGGVTGT